MGLMLELVRVPINERKLFPFRAVCSGAANGAAIGSPTAVLIKTVDQSNDHLPFAVSDALRYSQQKNRTALRQSSQVAVLHPS